MLCTITANTHAHAGAISTDGYYVFSGIFYLSLSFFITIFIIIMWHPLKAQFKYLYLFKARADGGSNEQCGVAAYFLDVIALKNFCL